MRKLNFLLAAVLTVGAAASAQPQETEVPFGGPADVAFALELWEALQEARLVGRTAIESRPYEGVEPHGVILTTLQSTLTIDGHEGAIIVKNNYLGKSVSVTSVADNPRLNLGAITVMYRRETGYDPETRNWFWAKFNNDGTLAVNPGGVRLAGRISKNPDDGCIACHRFAPGNDYVFLNDRFAVPDAFAVADEEIEGISTFSPVRLADQPDTTELEPGLNVTYYYNIFNFVDEVKEWARTEPGDIGAPILGLDYNTGSGRVLTSKQADGVAAIIDGLIEFPEAGVYRMALQSNDGAEVMIGGQVIFSDPGVHADRFSNLVVVQIDEPGWYPLNVLYFEKRNTSTLELYWLRPGEDGGLNFVPPDALARRTR